MSESTNASILAFFDTLAPYLKDLISEELRASSVERTMEGAIEEARSAFVKLLPDVPYLDQPNHTMAESMFFCAVGLAFVQPMEKRGFDLHTVGRAIYGFTKVFNEANSSRQDSSRSGKARKKSRREAEQSQQAQDPREFIWEIVDVESKDADTAGFNIKSCAICKLYAKHNAAELVPYMCAGDDVVSDVLDQGLDRTSTIALGANQCDFRFHYGKPGNALAPRFADRIRIITE